MKPLRPKSVRLKLVRKEYHAVCPECRVRLGLQVPGGRRYLVRGFAKNENEPWSRPPLDGPRHPRHRGRRVENHRAEDLNNFTDDVLAKLPILEALVPHFERWKTDAIAAFNRDRNQPSRHRSLMDMVPLPDRTQEDIICPFCRARLYWR